MTEPHACAARVIPKDSYGSFHPSRCTKKATLEYKGNWYCAIHHPPTATAREKAKPKCALCSTNVNGAKYCRLHGSVTITRDAFLALKGKAEAYDAIKENPDVK